MKIILDFLRKIWHTRCRKKMKNCLVDLPVKMEDQSRIDEKYRWRNGWSDIDRVFGVDWGNEE